MKSALRLVLFGFAMFATLDCLAANVIWGWFHSAQGTVGDWPSPHLSGSHFFSIEGYGSDASGDPIMPTSPEIEFICTVNAGVMTIAPTDELWLNLASCALWQVMEQGAIADYSTMAKRDKYLFYNLVDGTRSDYDIELSEGDTKYIAFMSVFSLGEDASDYGQNYSNPPAYGWVSVTYANGELTLSGSAVAPDGGPMIVGGGSALTPEPSGALLLLLGGCALALRRKSESER